MLRIVFAGSPAIAVPSLRAIAEHHHIVAVLTNPPSQKGRHGSLEPTPVGEAAAELISHGANFSILTPLKLDEQVREQIASCNPDILVCFAYGKFFGPKFMALYPRGGINLHPSLLPQFRGATPIPSAILARVPVTGFTVQLVAPEMDSGDIILQEKYLLTGTETTESLSEVAAQRGADLLVQALALLESEKLTLIAQDHANATLCGKITKEMGAIDWNEPAEVIDAKIRAYTPWPGAFTTVRDPKGADRILIIHGSSVVKNDLTGEPGTVVFADRQNGIQVITGCGILRLTELQWQTKKSADWKSFLNGAQNFASMKLL